MKRKGFAVYTILSTLGEEAALIALVLWGLPLIGINIPIWALAVMMAALAAYSSIVYWLCQRTLRKKVLVGLEALIGTNGKTKCPLIPKGYVQIKGELWKAVSADTYMDKDEEVIVIGLNKLTLLVTSLHGNNKSTYN